MKYPVKSSYSVYYAINGSVVKKTLKIEKKGEKGRNKKEKKERRKKLCLYKFETNVSWATALIDFTCNIFNTATETVLKEKEIS